jgi:predicted metal-binding membrane protein
MARVLEAVIRRDRVVIAAGLGGVALLAWLYLLRAMTAMAGMDTSAAMGMAMPRMEHWGVADVALMFLMWAVMMIAMMTPSAAPVILLFASVNRHRAARPAPVVRTGVFVAGYLLVWTAFSALAALAQWALHSAALLSPAMVSTTPYLGGALLIAAGAYQRTPLKEACLTTCRSPLGFLLGAWREGTTGALAMGLRHGAYCVGCCWALMGLLFVAGVMNLLWVAAIAAFVLAEKVLPWGDRVGRVAGVILVAAGALLTTTPLWR